MKITIFIVAFLLIGAFFIISNNNLHLSNGAEFHQFMSQYYGWFGKIFSNAAHATAYVVKLDWLP
jgi:hypothetical protein